MGEDRWWELVSLWVGTCKYVVWGEGRVGVGGRCMATVGVATQRTNTAGFVFGVQYGGVKTAISELDILLLAWPSYDEVDAP